MTSAIEGNLPFSLVDDLLPLSYDVTDYKPMRSQLQLENPCLQAAEREAIRTFSTRSTGSSQFPAFRPSSRISYSMIDESRFAEIAHFLWGAFHEREILGKSVNLGEHQPKRDVDEFVLRVLRKGTSICAICQGTGKIVGVILLEEAMDVENTSEEYQITNPAFKEILTFLDIVSSESRANLTDLYGSGKTWNFVILAVDPKYQFRGISKTLVQMGLDLATNRGGKIARCLSTGKISQRVFSSFGFGVVFEKVYNSYFVGGKAIFDGHSDTSTQVLAKMLVC